MNVLMSNWSYKPLETIPEEKTHKYIRADIVDSLIDKACKWLKEHADNYTNYDEFKGESWMAEDFITDFRKAMEE